MKTITYTVLGFSALFPALASAYFSDFGLDGYGMMGYGGGNNFFMVIVGTVWTIVGILAGVWLWQRISKK